jgi:hypothetical protein
MKDNNKMKRDLLVLHNKAGTVTAAEILIISQISVTGGTFLEQNGGLIRRYSTTKRTRMMVVEMTTIMTMPMEMETMAMDPVMDQALLADQGTVGVSGEITSTRGL